MTIAVVGGAGYIGAHVVQQLRADGAEVLVIDDLSTGRADRVPGVPLVCDVATDAAPDVLARAFAASGVRAVVLLAGRKQVAESMLRPAWYFHQNVAGTANVLLAMQEAGVESLVFSSSAAVYGATTQGTVDESAALAPLSPYGRTKLAGEWLVQDAARAWGLRALSLRYFNVAGAASRLLADDGATNLVPLTLRRLAKGGRPQIFGTDLPTADGTCVRDYVHVLDVASAHVAALHHLERQLGQASPAVLNVGTGTGSSVREVVDLIARETGLRVEPELCERRAGDAAHVVASVELIARTLGWVAQHDLASIIRSAVLTDREGLAAPAPRG